MKYQICEKAPLNKKAVSANEHAMTTTQPDLSPIHQITSIFLCISLSQLWLSVKIIASRI